MRGPIRFFRAFFSPPINIVSGVWNAEGDSTVAWCGNQAVWTASGSGTAAWVGGAILDAVWTAAGTSTVEWAAAGVILTVSGTGTATWVGASTAQTAMTAAGSSSVSWVAANLAVERYKQVILVGVYVAEIEMEGVHDSPRVFVATVGALD